MVISADMPGSGSLAAAAEGAGDAAETVVAPPVVAPPVVAPPVEADPPDVSSRVTTTVYVTTVEDPDVPGKSYTEPGILLIPQIVERGRLTVERDAANARTLVRLEARPTLPSTPIFESDGQQKGAVTCVLRDQPRAPSHP